jgi:hypothetical protein
VFRNIVILGRGEWKALTGRGVFSNKEAFCAGVGGIPQRGKNEAFYSPLEHGGGKVNPKV